MQLRKKSSQQKVTLNIAPLIDVIFLLIIFFMTLSQSHSESYPLVELPDTIQHNAPILTKTNTELVITIDANNNININNDTVLMTSLKKYLQKQIKQALPNMLYVRIRSDKNTHWYSVSKIMTICAKLEINQVNIGVQNQSVSISQ